MKVELSPLGTLSIIAETSVEAYALSHWFDLWQQHKVALNVSTAEEPSAAVVAPEEAEEPDEGEQHCPKCQRKFTARPTDCATPKCPLL